MSPGDLVFYESAKCLHARMKPLPTDSYTNMFVHFRPVGDEQWYKRENPPESPPPITEEDHIKAYNLFGNQNLKDNSGRSIRKTSTGDVIHTQPMKDYKELYDYWVDSATMSSCTGL